jgi:hypothetical protein
MLNDYVKGIITGILIMIIGVLLTVQMITPLEAVGSTCGESWNPCYVKLAN